MAVATEKVSEKEVRRNLPVCVLDDEPSLLELLTEKLQRVGFPVLGTTNPSEALQRVQMGACRAVLADVKMPRMEGPAFLERALQIDPGIYVILVTGNYSHEAAIEAVRRGAYDYLSKPLDTSRLLRVLDELAEQFARRSHIRELEEQLLENLKFHGIVGKSPAMMEVIDLARKVARHYTNILITGPTGSGKELVARALHQMSAVQQDRFAVCNCSALVDTLLESQLFGHVRGAFTGATETRPGLFEYASGGTVFLDEISEMSLAMQAKVLRVIQNREIQRVGSPEVRRVDVRLITATNRDLRADVLARRFREDLFYRLSTIELRVPGLGERPEDIPLLIQHFLEKCNEAYGKQIRGLTRRAQAALAHHDWPGNVRELENVISSAALTAPGDFIDIGDLPEHLQRAPSHARGRITAHDWQPLPLDEVRQIHIQRVLEMCKGNRVRASQMLRIGRTSLYRYIKRAQQKPSGKSAA